MGSEQVDDLFQALLIWHENLVCHAGEFLHGGHNLGCPSHLHDRRHISARGSTHARTCGTHFGLTKLPASMTVEPAWPSRFMSPTLTSGGMIVFSFWSPSLGPTSTILTGILLLAAVEYVPTESESVRRGETIAPLTVLVTALRDMSSYNNNFDKRESWSCQGIDGHVSIWRACSKDRPFDLRFRTTSFVKNLANGSSR